MTLLKPLGRWTVRTLRALTLAAALLGATGAVMAQTPATARAPASMPKRIYTKTTEFKLPIQMDEKSRASLERVCLYVKNGTGDWVRQETGPVTMPYFLYRVPQDGEYWFSLTTIDKAGKMSPADVSLEPPSLRVLVDTKAPVLDVQQWNSPEGELCLRCNVIDANADQSSVKAVAKLAGGDRPLAVHPSQPGTFKVTGGPEMLSASIVITASDLSGNQATREVRLRELIASQVQATNYQPPPTLPGRVSARLEMPPTPQVELPPPPALPGLPAMPTPAMTTPSFPETIPASLPQTPPAPPLPVANQAIVPVASNLRTQLDPTPGNLMGLSKQIISTTRAVLDYRIDQVGPSGVGKVEVYMTTDQGETWKKIGDDADRRSPVEFDLTGEGLFGIRLAVTNGNGFGGTPPQRGDAPSFVIDVDASAPFVQLRPIEPIVANGMLDIRWQATDKNLGSEPVNLYYRSRGDGAWQAIARGVKNDGVYRWAFPRDVTAQFFVKVEITDLAGNTARAETPNPVVLDMSEPRATVVGVTGLGFRPGN